MLYAEGCPGPGFNAGFRNGGPTHYTESITSIGNPLKSGLDLLESRPALLQQRGGLGKLKGDGAAFRIMLIIDIGVLPGCTHRADVLAECLQKGMLTVALPLEQDSEMLHVDHGLQGYRPTEAPSRITAGKNSCPTLLDQANTRSPRRRNGGAERPTGADWGCD